MKHYKQLSEEVPNLVAVKNTGVTLADLQEFHSSELPVEFFNLEYAYGFASLIGSCSLLISVCNMNYKRASEYFNAGINRDLASIIAIHNEIEKVHSALAEHIPGGLMDGAYDKLFVKYNLPGFSQRLCPPYTGATDAQYENFANAIRKNLPSWSQ